MPVLYRKYRPQTFNGVVSQQAIVQTLRNAVINGTPAHAYLFTGSRGVGKTSVARILARALNCPNGKNGEACLKCDICQQFNAGFFLDLIEIDAASNTGVDNIRELIEHVRFTPSKGKYKVFIIDEVHMLSKGAFNALLKTLEEPPTHAIFILATTEAHKVPLTIISRTQRFDFHRLSEVDIADFLAEVCRQEKWHYDTDVLGLIARQAEGSLRDALSLLDKLAAIGDKLDRPAVERLLGLSDERVSQELIEAIIARSPERLPELFDRWLEAGLDFFIFNRNLLEYLRRLLMVKLGGGRGPGGEAGGGASNGAKSATPDESKQVLQRQADQLTVNQLMHIIRLFLRSFKELPFAPNQDLPLLLAGIEASYRLAAVGAEVPVNLVKEEGRGLVASEIPTMTAAAENNQTRGQRVARTATAQTLEPPVDTSVTEAQIKEHWSGIIEAIKKINSPLATLVKNLPLAEVQDGVVTLEVRYLFHKEHLESAKQRALIINAIAEVMGKRVGLSARLAKTEPAAASGDTVNLLTDALRVFGGELVE